MRRMWEEKSGDEWDNDTKPRYTSYLNLLRKPRTHGDHGQAIPTADKASEYRIFKSATTEIWKIQNGRWTFASVVRVSPLVSRLVLPILTLSRATLVLEKIRVRPRRPYNAGLVW